LESIRLIQVNRSAFNVYPVNLIIIQGREIVLCASDTSTQIKNVKRCANHAKKQSSQSKREVQFVSSAKLELRGRRAKVVNQDGFKIDQVQLSAKNVQKDSRKLLKDKHPAFRAFLECTLKKKDQLHAKTVR
jgi:hypothetical protein